MKILLTSDTWTPTVNGVVTSATTLKRELESRGHEVRVLTLSQNSRTYTERDVTYLGSLDAGRVYPGARLRSPALHGALHELAQWSPDVVHSQCEFSTFSPARYLAKAAGAPLIHTYHTVYEDYTHYFSPSRCMGRRLAALFTRSICNCCDAVIAPTPKIRSLLLGYGVQCPVQILPTGLELTRFAVPRDDALRRRLHLPDDKKVLLYLGRLAKEKDISTLISVMPDLPDAVLLVVGDGPERAALTQLAQHLQLADRVIFTGMVSPADVPRYYALADAFVSASASEAQGLTYLEALAAGLPLLCRDDPCLKNLVQQGQNGYVWQNPAQLVRLSHTLLYRDDPDILRKNAVASARPYSAAAFAAAAEQLYRREILRKTQQRQILRREVVLW